MNEFEFDVKGFEKLQKKFSGACQNYSDICAKVIEKKAREFKKELVKNTDEVVKEHTGKLKKGYKFKRTEFIDEEIQKKFQVKARQFHLVEKGHNLVSKDGRRIGWVNGRFFLKKTVQEFPPHMIAGMQEVCDKIVKECNK